jgi:hypothetical protein
VESDIVELMCAMKQAILSTPSLQPCAETTSAYRQYISARVKMALRHHARVIVPRENMEQFQDEVVQIVFRLFNECPPDAVASGRNYSLPFGICLILNWARDFSINRMCLFEMIGSCLDPIDR